jgi:hypothetical protein
VRILKKLGKRDEAKRLEKKIVQGKKAAAMGLTGKTAQSNRNLHNGKALPNGKKSPANSDTAKDKKLAEESSAMEE